MEKIKAGEYFRCKKFGRIGKYLDSFYDGTEFNVNCEPNCTFVYHSKEDFISSIKHSKDIIDLIEVGDIVTVEEIGTEWERTVEVDEEKYIKYLKMYVGKEEKIKAILTHEMYNQNCYKVGED